MINKIRLEGLQVSLQVELLKTAKPRFQPSLLIIAGFFLGLGGCVDKPDVISPPNSEFNSEAKSARILSPAYASYVVCSAKFPDGRRYSHMLRITAALDVIEFTGGLGQRLFVTQTAAVKLPDGQLLASFAAQDGISAFDLSIDRSSLAYGLTYNLARTVDKVFVEGRCSVLEGDGFEVE